MPCLYLLQPVGSLAVPQEEYQDLQTLEQRLQHVARNLVGTGRAASAQRQQQQQQQQVMQQQMANNGFPACGMQPYPMQMQGMGAQMPGMYQQASSIGVAQGNAPQQAFAAQQRAMGGMGSAPGFRVAPGPGMQSSLLPADQVALPANGFQQQQQQQQQHPGMSRGQVLPSGAAPVMSNGAPVLLRNAPRNEWGAQNGTASLVREARLRVG